MFYILVRSPPNNRTSVYKTNAILKVLFNVLDKTNLNV